MFDNKVKQLLAQGEAGWGDSLPDASELIAQLTVDTGVDFLWIDTEHRPFDTFEIRSVRDRRGVRAACPSSASPA